MPADVELLFGLDEYAERLARTRAAMEARRLEVLIVVDPSNMAWLTGYDGWSFYVHQAVVITLDAEALWWGRAMDGFGALRTVYMDEASVLSYHDDFVQSTERHPMQDLAAKLGDRGYGNTRIGVEMENYYFSAKAYMTLVAELPDATIEDATALVNWQRKVKSDAEIAVMRKAARIVERMHECIRERIAPGIRKNDLVAEIYATSLRGTEEFGGDYPAIVPLLQPDETRPRHTSHGTTNPCNGERVLFSRLRGCTAVTTSHCAEPLSLAHRRRHFWTQPARVTQRVTSHVPSTRCWTDLAFSARAVAVTVSD
tara:strand:+ start:1912 stop:2850 length:939 start_codon:yes stop_codon:yes gene_type:complete